MNTWIWLYMVTMFVPMSILLIFSPYFTRKTVSFGISISEEIYHSPILKALRKQYALIMTVLMIILFSGCLYLIGGKTNALGTVFPLSIIGIIACSSIVSFLFYSRMKKLKIIHNWNSQQLSRIAIDLSSRKQALRSNWWYVLHAAIIVGCFFFTLSHYDQIPAQIAMKFDFEGNIISIANKSYGIVFMPQVLQIFMFILFFILNYSIRSSKQIIDVSKPEVSRQQDLLFRRRSSTLLLVIGLSVILLLGIIQWNFVYPWDIQILTYIIHLFVSIVLLGIIWLAFTTGQGGSRVAAHNTHAGAGQHFRNDDAFWKLGAIYFNPNDPSIFVEKRMGVGWTLNFARPVSWISLLVLIVVIVGIVVYSSYVIA
ncbi:DUF1648 domain-containing protein [Paenibacillus sp. KN14-4R]|uniref:DUF1648 domain-containing protein n=1 Tax=Paenibacillus sp. KN14-4R TaxID=3445773 RepID=UPI003F9EE459